MSKAPSFDFAEFRSYIREYSPVYIPIFNNELRYEVVYGGSGSGKSHIVARKLLYRLLYEKEVNHKILVVRKVDRTIKRSVFELFKNLIVKWNLYGDFTINLTDKTMTYKPTGSQILFTGLDDVERLKSIEGITAIWCEEATELMQEDFEQLDLRLRGETGTYKQIIVTFNPISAENWVKKVFFDSGMKNVFILKTTYIDNQFIDAEYKEVLDAKKLTNPRYYKIYALAEWGTAEGLVFGNFTRRMIREDDIRGLEGFYGLDFGYSIDPTAFCQNFVNHAEKKIYVYDGFYSKGMSNSQIANKLIELKVHKHEITADSSEPKSIASIKAKGVPRIKGAKKGADSINAGIDFLLDYEIIINSHLTDFEKEFLNYSWAKDRNGRHTGKPIDDYNHFIDAFRYSTEKLQTRRGGRGRISKPSGL